MRKIVHTIPRASDLRDDKWIRMKRNEVSEKLKNADDDVDEVEGSKRKVWGAEKDLEMKGEGFLFFLLPTTSRLIYLLDYS